MNIRRFLSLALMLALVLMLTMLPIRAEAATVASGECGANLTWTLDDKGTLTISGTGPMENYASELNDMPLGDGAPWVDHKGNIKKVCIADGVTTIGTAAFEYCPRLTDVTIPDSVTTIGDSAFFWCGSLTSVTIPNSVTRIGAQAFRYCFDLTSVTIPASVTTIDTAAFLWCDSLTGIHVAHDNPNYSSDSFGVLFNKQKTVLIQAPGALSGSYTIPDSVISIGGAAFCCYNLTSVTIPDSVKTIGDYAFNECGNLTGVTIPDSVASIGDYAFYCCESLIGMTIPNSVTTIGDRAFQDCSNLTSVTIPGSVTTIGYSAFRGCTSLTGIHVAHDNPNYASDSSGVLFNKQKTTLIQAPGALSGSYTIPDSVTMIGDWAFYFCESLTNVTIPGSITTIGYSVYWGCNSLETVCYDGTPEQWNQISIGLYNERLTDYSYHHFNENGDHKCDTCGRVLSQCADKNWDGQCDICGRNVPIPVPEKPYKIANVVSGVHVYWKATEGAAKYGLWRSETGKNGTYKWVANPTVPHFTDTKVTSGKTYYYKVTSMSAAGTHGEKSEAIGVTYVATPDITSRFNKAAGITLGWNKIQGATGYAIYRKSYSGSDAWVRVGTVSGNATFTWQDTSVKNNNGTAYKYTVRALAGSDMKTLSGCRNAGRSMVRLTSRTLSSAVKASATSIKCSWNTSSAVTGYEVRFMVGSTVYKTFTVGNYKTGTKTFTGLKSGQTYKIQVRSYVKIDGMGFYSAWSEAKSVKLS